MFGVYPRKQVNNDDDNDAAAAAAADCQCL